MWRGERWMRKRSAVRAPEKWTRGDERTEEENGKGWRLEKRKGGGRLGWVMGRWE